MLDKPRPVHVVVCGQHKAFPLGFYRNIECFTSKKKAFAFIAMHPDRLKMWVQTWKPEP